MKRTIENYFDRAREAAERIGAEKGAAAIEIRDLMEKGSCRILR